MHYYHKPSPLIDKLVILAKGDIRLLSKAISHSSVRGLAPLNKVIEYILKHRSVS